MESAWDGRLGLGERMLIWRCGMLWCRPNEKRLYQTSHVLYTTRLKCLLPQTRTAVILTSASVVIVKPDAAMDIVTCNKGERRMDEGASCFRSFNNGGHVH
jgi:hypothetical protein